MNWLTKLHVIFVGVVECTYGSHTSRDAIFTNRYLFDIVLYPFFIYCTHTERKWTLSSQQSKRVWGQCQKWLKISITKKKLDYRQRERPPLGVFLGTGQLQRKDDFCTGGTISCDVWNDKDIDRRVWLASGIAINSNNMWKAKDVTQSKCQSWVVSDLPWCRSAYCIAQKRGHWKRTVDVFEMSVLPVILDVSLKDRRWNVVLKRTGCQTWRGPNKSYSHFYFRQLVRMEEKIYLNMCCSGENRGIALPVTRKPQKDYSEMWQTLIEAESLARDRSNWKLAIERVVYVFVAKALSHLSKSCIYEI